MLVRGEKHHVERARLRRGLERTKAVGAGHLHIQKHQVGREAAHRRERFLSGSGLRDLLHFGVALQETAHLAARGWLVIHNEHANHVRNGTATVTARPPSSQFSNWSVWPDP